MAKPISTSTPLTNQLGKNWERHIPLEDKIKAEFRPNSLEWLIYKKQQMELNDSQKDL